MSSTIRGAALCLVLLVACAESAGDDPAFEDAVSELDEFNDAGKYDLFGISGVDACVLLDPIFEYGERLMRAGYIVGVSGPDVLGENTGRGGYELVFDIYHQQLTITGHVGHSILAPPWASDADTDEAAYYDGIAFGLERGAHDWHGLYAEPVSAFGVPFTDKIEAKIPPLFVRAVDNGGDTIPDGAVLPPNGVYGFTDANLDDVEFEVTPADTTLAPAFFGTECTEDEEVCDVLGDGTAGSCLEFERDEHDWGICTSACEGLCPDLGDRKSYCVSLDGGVTGSCLPVAGAQNLGCATIPGTGPEARKRHVGSSGYAVKTKTVCVPGGPRAATLTQPYQAAVRQYYDWLSTVRFAKVGKKLKVALVDSNGAACPTNWPTSGGDRDCVIRFGDPKASNVEQAVHTAYALCKATDGCETRLSFHMSIAALAVAAYRDSGVGYETLCGE